MTLSEDLLWRGLVKDKTFDDVTYLDIPQTFYLGVDCSSDSMTIGNLAVFLAARRLLDAGWNTVLLVGGATSLIGDPGGKDEERSLKSREEIQANVAGIRGQVERLFSGKSFRLVDNYDWFKDVHFLEFLRDVGKHFSMSELVGRDYIQARMGEGGAGISYAEFSYSLIQGYDFLHLFDNYGVVMQLGGSDQWGNMLSGVPLIRKKTGGEAHAFSIPLVVNKTTGKKFGKSEDGAVWLDETKTSVYQFYQFWLNVDDAGVEDYVKVYTLLDKPAVDAVMTRHSENPGAREAQRVLAYEVTKLVHGEARAEQARNVTAALFGDTPPMQLLGEELDMLAREIPVTSSSHIVNALVTSGVATSNGEARRLIASGAISLNGEKVSDDAELHAPSLVKKGKNTFILVR